MMGIIETDEKVSMGWKFKELKFDVGSINEDIEGTQCIRKTCDGEIRFKERFKLNGDIAEVYECNKCGAKRFLSDNIEPF